MWLIAGRRAGRSLLILASSAIVFAASPLLAKEQNSVGKWRAEIAEASARFDVPVGWIERVMRAESRGRTMQNGKPITSPAGAMGLMQLMPETWAELRRRLGLGSDPHAARDNILAGTAYLREMYDRFGYPGMFAAYNAGPKRYAASLASGRALPAETRAYLVEVAGRAPESATAFGYRAPPQTIFVALGAVREPTDIENDQSLPRAKPPGETAAMAAVNGPPPRPSMDPLFVVRPVP